MPSNYSDLDDYPEIIIGDYRFSLQYWIDGVTDNGVEFLSYTHQELGYTNLNLLLRFIKSQCEDITADDIKYLLGRSLQEVFGYDTIDTELEAALFVSRLHHLCACYRFGYNDFAATLPSFAELMLGLHLASGAKKTHKIGLLFTPHMYLIALSLFNSWHITINTDTNGKWMEYQGGSIHELATHYLDTYPLYMWICSRLWTRIGKGQVVTAEDLKVDPLLRWNQPEIMSVEIACNCIHDFAIALRQKIQQHFPSPEDTILVSSLPPIDETFKAMPPLCKPKLCHQSITPKSR